MPESYENWLCLIYSYVYYARQTRGFTRYCLTQCVTVELKIKFLVRLCTYCPQYFTLDFSAVVSYSIKASYHSTPVAETHGIFTPLRWRHNECDNVLNLQPHECLLNGLFRSRSKKTSKLRVTGLCVGNSPGPVNSLHKGPVTRKMFPFDDVIMPIGLMALSFWVTKRWAECALR